MPSRWRSASSGLAATNPYVGRTVPSPVVFGDVEFSVLRPALVAVQPRSREEQDCDIQQQDSGHPDQDGDVGDIAQNTNEAQGEGQHDHDRRDLGKGLVSKEIFTATGDASSELTTIVEAAFPVQEHLLIGVEGGRPCRLLVRIDLDLAQPATVFLSYHDSHVVDGMAVHRILEARRPFSSGRGGIVPG